MSLIISKRKFLTGLLATPALVAAGSLMPLSAKTSQRFTLESFTSIPSYNKWCLIKTFKSKSL